MDSRKRRRWSDTDIGDAVRAIAREYGRMPSASELRDRGRNDLACRVSTRGGFRFWATKLGLELKDSATRMGQGWEECVWGILLGFGYDVERQTTRCGFDLLVNGKLRINVKSARFHTYFSATSTASGFFFGIGHTWKNCDLFALVKVIPDQVPVILWVPTPEIRQQQTVVITDKHRLSGFTDVRVVKRLLTEISPR